MLKICDFAICNCQRPCCKLRPAGAQHEHHSLHSSCNLHAPHAQCTCMPAPWTCQCSYQAAQRCCKDELSLSASRMTSAGAGICKVLMLSIAPASEGMLLLSLFALYHIVLSDYLAQGRALNEPALRASSMASTAAMVWMLDMLGIAPASKTQQRDCVWAAICHHLQSPRCGRWERARWLAQQLLSACPLCWALHLHFASRPMVTCVYIVLACWYKSSGGAEPLSESAGCNREPCQCMSPKP